MNRSSPLLAHRPARGLGPLVPWRLGAWVATVGLAALPFAAHATSATARPGPGAYAGRLCVQPLTAAADAAAPPLGSASGTATPPADAAGHCGPVELTLQAGNRASVRFSDIVYRLQLHSSQVDVVLMHGAMQIDGFTTDYDWQGSTLRFSDRDKGLSYRVHFDARPARASR